MTKHELKIWTDYFEDVRSGAKKYEIRRNDRDFKVGDELFLREYNPHTDSYTGLTCIAKVVHMTTGGDDSSPAANMMFEDTCVMGIEVIA